MPFTPTILDYRAKDYLINPKNLKAPYMTIAFNTTLLCRKQLKAAIHPYDFTARNAEDAWHTFINSDLDALLLNKTLIIKK